MNGSDNLSPFMSLQWLLPQLTEVMALTQSDYSCFACFGDLNLLAVSRTHLFVASSEALLAYLLLPNQQPDLASVEILEPPQAVDDFLATASPHQSQIHQIRVGLIDRQEMLVVVDDAGRVYLYNCTDIKIPALVISNVRPQCVDNGGWSIALPHVTSITDFDLESDDEDLETEYCDSVSIANPIKQYARYLRQTHLPLSRAVTGAVQLRISFAHPCEPHEAESVEPLLSSFSTVPDVLQGQLASTSKTMTALGCVGNVIGSDSWLAVGSNSRRVSIWTTANLHTLIEQCIGLLREHTSTIESIPTQSASRIHEVPSPDLSTSSTVAPPSSFIFPLSLADHYRTLPGGPTHNIPALDISYRHGCMKSCISNLLSHSHLSRRTGRYLAAASIDQSLSIFDLHNEGVCAGRIVICDEPGWAVRWFPIRACLNITHEYVSTLSVETLSSTVSHHSLTYYWHEWLTRTDMSVLRRRALEMGLSDIERFDRDILDQTFSSQSDREADDVSQFDDDSEVDEYDDEFDDVLFEPEMDADDFGDHPEEVNDDQHLHDDGQNEFSQVQLGVQLDDLFLAVDPKNSRTEIHVPVNIASVDVEVTVASSSCSDAAVGAIDNDGATDPENVDVLSDEFEELLIYATHSHLFVLSAKPPPPSESLPYILSAKTSVKIQIEHCVPYAAIDSRFQSHVHLPDMLSFIEVLPALGAVIVASSLSGQIALFYLTRFRGGEIRFAQVDLQSETLLNTNYPIKGLAVYPVLDSCYSNICISSPQQLSHTDSSMFENRPIRHDRWLVYVLFINGAIQVLQLRRRSPQIDTY